MADSANWWAVVRYLERYGVNRHESVQVSCIEFEHQDKDGNIVRKPFKPEHLDNFEHVWYVVWSSKDVLQDQEGVVKRHPFYGVIGKLSETKEGLETSGRAKYPIIHEPNSEPDSSVEQPASTVPTRVIQHQRHQRLNRKAEKRHNENAQFESFMKDNILTSDDRNTDDQDDSESVAALKEKIRILEEKANSSFSASSFEETVIAGFNKLQKEVQSLRSSIAAVKEEL